MDFSVCKKRLHPARFSARGINTISSCQGSSDDTSALGFDWENFGMNKDHVVWEHQELSCHMEIVMECPHVSWIALLGLPKGLPMSATRVILRVCASIDELSNQVVVDVTLAAHGCAWLREKLDRPHRKLLQNTATLKGTFDSENTRRDITSHYSTLLNELSSVN